MTITDLELAALAHEWPVWARPKQVPPETGWKSFGFITGRGFGKTRALCEFVIGEVMAGRARQIGFAAQKLEVAEDAMRDGPDGLVQRSPPWFRPVVVKGHVEWPNGAVAIPFTPEVPDGPRNYSHDLLWLAEMSSWPASTRDEFFSNMRYTLRLGLGRMVFDTTPKARNPLVRYLIDRAKRDPLRHVLVRGATHENQANLTEDFVAELETDYGGTQKGREELLGEFFDDAEGALFQQLWIDRARREMPTAFKRRAISVDPAISLRKGTDATGIVEVALGIDDQVFVLSDETERLAPELWGAKVIQMYGRGACDCVIVERNRGGDLVLANLRACAKERGLRIERVESDAPTRHVENTIYVKETHVQKSKALRAEPIATLYERGRVSHAIGADLADLEESMCTWDPNGGGESPNAIDAMVHGIFELANLSRESKRDTSRDIEAAVKMQAQITAPPARGAVDEGAVDIAALLMGNVGRGGGDRI